MKQLCIHILIVLILCGVFCDGYFTISQLSSGRIWLADSEVYAADDWEAVTQDDLVTAFQYYCKSRNLTIDGSIADALTSFTTTTFNNICNTLGIDVNSLQANLKKTVEGNLGLRFLMNQQGVLAYNRIFAEFLQNNDLSVGDSVEDKVLQSGKHYGNQILWQVPHYYGTFDISQIVVGTYIYGSNTPVGTYDLSNTNIQVSTFKVYNITNATIFLSSNGTTSTSTYAGFHGTARVADPNRAASSCLNATNGSRTISGGIGYAYVEDTNKVRVLGISHDSKYPNIYYCDIFSDLKTTDGIEDYEVYITTNNNIINNNDYSKNYTIIYNDGNTYESDDDPDPDQKPAPPAPPSPSGPDLPDWGSPHGTGTIGSDGTFDFDIPFSLPDLNIDWSLKNIGNKFPFCIPSDIVSFYQVLAVEPEAPAIDAHIPLGSFYDWHFEADFAQYDNWARIIRIVEYVGFVITLIYFTVKLVKG